ncbi:hypothetical protein JOF34_001825 [Microbacterium amylolyticum]|uniref:Uncharacterized protein n=1 Tax=Microbacterium amylolyticum TaxID=936337 RepID=A0ABS4ZIY3_9MICO|nr:hypothetical protein [Microbacterium amylolyticum]
MESHPSIRTTDALGRYVLRHCEYVSRTAGAEGIKALSMGRRLFCLSSSLLMRRTRGDLEVIPPEAIRGRAKGRNTCAPWY